MNKISSRGAAVFLLGTLAAFRAQAMTEISYSSASVNLDGSRQYLRPKAKKNDQRYRVQVGNPTLLCLALGAEGYLDYGTQSALFSPYQAVVLDEQGDASEPAACEQVIEWIRCSVSAPQTF